MNGWIFLFHKIDEKIIFSDSWKAKLPFEALHQHLKRLISCASPHAEFTSHTPKPHERVHPGPRALTQFCRLRVWQVVFHSELIMSVHALYNTRTVIINRGANMGYAVYAVQRGATQRGGAIAPKQIFGNFI